MAFDGLLSLLVKAISTVQWQVACQIFYSLVHFWPFCLYNPRFFTEQIHPVCMQLCNTALKALGPRVLGPRFFTEQIHPVCMQLCNTALKALGPRVLGPRFFTEQIHSVCMQLCNTALKALGPQVLGSQSLGPKSSVYSHLFPAFFFCKWLSPFTFNFYPDYLHWMAM